MTEIPTKPYLIRAIHEWCIDNGYTPYIAVSVNKKTRVPAQYVKAGEIVLNCSPLATQGLLMGNELVEFQARFGGVAQNISVPVEQISAIYARENGQGMAFEVPKPLGEVQSAQDDDGGDTDPDSSSGSTASSGGPVLASIGGNQASKKGSEGKPDPEESNGSGRSNSSPDDEPEPTPPSGGAASKKGEKKSPGKRKNHLTRVK